MSVKREKKKEKKEIGKGFLGRHHSIKTRMKISLAQKGKARPHVRSIESDRKCVLCQSTKTYTDRNNWSEWYKHPALAGFICDKCYRANKKKVIAS